MKKINLSVAFSLMFSFCIAQSNDSAMIRSIYSEALVNGKAYKWLYDLTTKIGGRLAGSPQAAQAVEFSRKAMIEAGADSVWLQEVTVPHWVRGEKESAIIIQSDGKKQSVPVCALGNSIATSKDGITASIIEVHDFDELRKLGDKVKGKIVFYNHPFDQKFIFTFEAYGEAVKYRWAGPSEAARYGAVAAIVRSMSSSDNDFPHTGSMGYNDSLPKVPCAAISTNAANLLSAILKADPKTKFFLKQSCQMLDSVKSNNVVGEIKGSEHPEEIIDVGGHLDSWETGKGAQDDGAGVVQGIEVLRLFKALGIKPKRTIRAVAWMNEENGGMGGKKYEELADANHEKHILGMESDAGGFVPRGFSFDCPEETKETIKKWAPLFVPYGLHDFDHEGGGSDIGPLKKLKVPMMGLRVDSQRYFDVHHAASDVIENVNRRELLLGAASEASMIYLIQEHGL